jgi:hypothetical protein
MVSPFDLLPKVQPSEWPNEPYPGATGVIGRVFDATDTTYKFYWFLSLLEHVSRAQENDRLNVSISEIGREMIVQAWYTRRQFRLWFGHQDRLQLVIDHLGETSSLEPAGTG